jgi:outer membrane protein TolC
MAAAMIQSDKAVQSVKIAKAAYLPKLDLVVSKSKDNNKNMLSSRSDFFAGVRMTWEFNLGGESLYLEDAAVKTSMAQQERADNIRNKTSEAVRMSWNQVINGKERLELLSDASSIAKQVMMDRKKLRDAGKETALSVLDAEVEYYGVLANRINALYDTRINSYRLLSAVGKLSPDIIGLNDGKLRLPVQSLNVDLDNL